MKPVTFGTDGIRGPAGTHPITDEVARAVGRAATQLAAASGGMRVLVARDTRPSGAQLAAEVGHGVRQAGGAWLDGGVLPTSGVGLAVHAGLADVGVMVTASHNPLADNGFKVLGAAGAKLDEAACAAVQAWMQQPPGEVDGASRTDVAKEAADVWRRSVRAAAGDVGVLAGQRIAVDLAAGAGIAATSWLAGWLQADLVLTGVEGPINQGCGSEHLEHLGEVVRAEGCVAGFAIDGDGDRCRVVDERGQPVPGDAVIWLLARHMDATGLACTIMSNGALERSLPGVRVERTAVGDRHVGAALVAHDFVVGGEESGHLLFRDFPDPRGPVVVGDGILAGVRTLVAALSQSEPLSEVFGRFEPLPRRVSKVPVSARPPLSDVPEFVQIQEQVTGDLGEHGRVLLRYSGTEPVLRVLVEGTGERAVQEGLERVLAVARSVLA
ncbi:MAG: hypothetical protein KTR31_09920 [Myxococcales bacterium]|nr:hypothetical protein [Myxococcales bacterium]